jgi:hypothetical protein
MSALDLQGKAPLSACIVSCTGDDGVECEGPNQNSIWKTRKEAITIPGLLSDEA